MRRILLIVVGEARDWDQHEVLALWRVRCKELKRLPCYWATIDRTNQEVRKQWQSRFDWITGLVIKVRFFGTTTTQSHCLMSTTALLPQLSHEFTYKPGPTFPAARASRQVKYRSVLHGLVNLAL